MKFLRPALVVILATVAFTACKKDDIRPSFSIEGSWVGKIGTGSASPSGQYALNIKADGTLERISSNGAVSATGAWNMQDNTFTGIYFYSSGTVVDVNGTVDKSNNKLTASWKNNGGEEGTLYVIKQ